MISSYISIFINLFAALGTVVASWAAIRALKIQASPDILLYIVPDDESGTFARLVVRNNGDAAAFNVRFTLDKALFARGDSVLYEMANHVFSSGYAILPPKCERTILLGEFRNLESLWGDEVYEVAVSYTVKWRSRCKKVVCPIEIASYKGMVTITHERQIEKDAKKAFRSIAGMGKSLEAMGRSLDAVAASRLNDEK